MEKVPTKTIKQGYAIPGGNYNCCVAIIDKQGEKTKSMEKFRLSDLQRFLRGTENNMLISDGWRPWLECHESTVFKYLPDTFSPGVETNFKGN